MRVAVMQPYFFPYIGYFQLMRAVDVFVVYDDVNFIKQGWITRNNILIKNETFRINLIVEGASSNKKINEISRKPASSKWLKTVEQSYKKAPYFHSIYPIIEKISDNKELNLAKFLMFSLKEIATYLELNTKLIFSSDIKKNMEMKGQERVITICKELKASNYINAIGGKELYSKQEFSNHKITLNFIKSNLIKYKQKENHFIPWLSIIDVLMFNDKDEVQKQLTQFELI